MPRNQEQRRGQDAARAVARRRDEVCATAPTQIRVRSARGNHVYSLHESCRTINDNINRRNTERQQIREELRRLNTENYSIQPDPFLGVLQRIGNNPAALAGHAITLTCILDGWVHMKSQKTVQPNVRERLQQYIRGWIDNTRIDELHIDNIKRSILKLLLR